MAWQSHSQAYTLRKPKLKKDTCILLFIAALFTIARTWKQPRCPSTDEWIKKLQPIDTMEYYSAIKRNTFESDLIRWMNLGQERVRCMERVTWKLTLPYVKQIAKGNLLYGSGNSNRGSVSIQRDGLGQEMRGRFKREGIYVSMGD